MPHWLKWRTQRLVRSARAQKAANARWAAVRAARAGEPPRQTRVVELTLRDTHRPMRIILLEAEPTENGWGRWAVTENGERIGRRRFGRTRIGQTIAGSL